MNGTVEQTKVYDVLNLSSGVWFKVNDEWLDAIPRKGITSLTTRSSGSELVVGYANGNEVYYKNIHGTWEILQYLYNKLIGGSIMEAKLSIEAVAENEVLELIKDDDGRFENDLQFCYACGKAIKYLINKRKVNQKANAALLSNSLRNQTLMQLKTKTMNVIKSNFQEVEKLPQTGRNLFGNIAGYIADVEKITTDMERCLVMGVISNRKFYTTSTEKWQEKTGYISKSYKLKEDLVDNFAKKCEEVEMSQAKQLTKMMQEFIDNN